MLPLTYVSHIHIKWIRGTDSHLVDGVYCDDVYLPYGGVLLAKVAGVGAPSFVVWTFMDECLSATSILGVSKKVVWSFLTGSVVKNLPAM